MITVSSSASARSRSRCARRRMGSERALLERQRQLARRLRKVRVQAAHFLVQPDRTPKPSVTHQAIGHQRDGFGSHAPAAARVPTTAFPLTRPCVVWRANHLGDVEIEHRHRAVAGRSCGRSRNHACVNLPGQPRRAHVQIGAIRTQGFELGGDLGGPVALALPVTTTLVTASPLSVAVTPDTRCNASAGRESGKAPMSSAVMRPDVLRRRSAAGAAAAAAAAGGRAECPAPPLLCGLCMRVRLVFFSPPLTFARPGCRTSCIQPPARRSRSSCSRSARPARYSASARPDNCAGPRPLRPGSRRESRSTTSAQRGLSPHGIAAREGPAAMALLPPIAFGDLERRRCGRLAHGAPAPARSPRRARAAAHIGARPPAATSGDPHATRSPDAGASATSAQPRPPASSAVQTQWAAVPG